MSDAEAKDESTSYETIAHDEGGDTSVLSCKDVTCVLELKDGRQTRILDNISCSNIYAGKITAMLGASGSGKTTLLNVLANRLVKWKTLHRLDGEVLFQGRVRDPDEFAFKTGYVQQTVYLQPNLTVYETFMFAARLRMPELSAEECAARICFILTELKLWHVKNTLVGGRLVKGISGGETKRATIGIELLRIPQLLFLDEPTSGLDSTNAFKIIYMLSQTCKRTNSAIVLTIHSPSSIAFERFDQLILLHEGACTYSGTGSHLYRLLNRIGFELPPNCNPADFIMDFLTLDSSTLSNGPNGSGSSAARPAIKRPSTLSSKGDQVMVFGFDRRYALFNVMSVQQRLTCLGEAQEEERRERMAGRTEGEGEGEEEGTEGERREARRSALEPEPIGSMTCGSTSHGSITTIPASTTTVEGRGGEGEGGERRTGKGRERGKGTRGSGAGEEGDLVLGERRELRKQNTASNEFYILFKRNWLNFNRDPRATVYLFCSNFFVSVVLGVLFWQLAFEDSDATNRLGLLFFAVTNQSFSTIMTVLYNIMQEKPTFVEENANRSYRVWTYYVTKQASEIPFSVLNSVVFSSLLYWMAGLQAVFWRYVVFLGIILLTMFVAKGLGIFIAALSSSLEIANVFAPIITLVFLLFGGFFINIDDIPSSIRWLAYSSFIRYGFVAVAQNELQGLEFTTESGVQVLDFFNLNSPDPGWCALVLLAMALAYAVMGYLALKYSTVPDYCTL